MPSHATTIRKCLSHGPFQRNSASAESKQQSGPKGCAHIARKKPARTEEPTGVPGNFTRIKHLHLNRLPAVASDGGLFFEPRNKKSPRLSPPAKFREEMPKRAKSPAERTVDRAVGFSDAERKARCWPRQHSEYGIICHTCGGRGRPLLQAVRHSNKTTASHT